MLIKYVFVGHKCLCWQCFSFQVLELIAKETCLLRDRQLLAREVEFLRGQFLSVPKFSDCNNVAPNIIDDILCSVKSNDDKFKADPKTDASEENSMQILSEADI